MNPLSPFAFIDKVPLGILVIDDKYTVREWNQILVGWTDLSKDKTIGQNIQELYPELKNKRYQMRLDGVLKGGPPTVFSPQLHHHFIPIELNDGNLAVQQTTVSPIQLEDGGRAAIICIQDVTDLSNRVSAVKTMRDQALEEVKMRKKTEEKLAQLNEEFKAFSQRVAHDLRGPLGMSVNLADLGIRAPDNVERVKDLFERIRTSSSYGIRIIDGLYKLSGLSSNNIVFKEIELNLITDIVLSQLEESLKNAKLEVVCDFKHSFVGSEELVPQVFQNLIANAIKYCNNEYPKILLYSTASEKEIELHFEDNGSGIPEDQRKKVLEAFYRLKEHKESDGLGLGLSLVKRIVEIHEGSFEIRDPEKLEGAHFVVGFPKDK